MTTTISIDTGGTFTDGFVTRDGQAVSVKVFTTPHDVTVGMFECVQAAADALEVDVERLVTGTDTFRFSSTIVTNALLEGRGAVVGAIVTADRESRDTDELIQRELLRPDLVIAVPADGPRDAVEAAIETLLDRGAQVLAVSLDGSHVDPSAERGVRRVVRELFPAHYLGSIRTFLASDITPLPDTAVRTHTAVMNAHVHDLLARGMYGAENRLRTMGMPHPFLLVQSHGGVARTSKTLALHTFNSGPAAGALGGLAAGSEFGSAAPVSFDVGGTSTDIALLSNDRLSTTWDTGISGLPVHLPVVPVESFAVGGGTIAWIDDGSLRLGPRSAGAHPGPACFDRGGAEPTVTDANLLLGFLDATSFHGGRFPLRPDLAEGALARLGGSLGWSAVEVAREIRRAAAEEMASHVRNLLTEADVPPTGAALVAYGGGGGLHAAAVAELVGIRQVVVPWQAAVFSAVGVSTLDIRHVYPLWLGPDVTTEAATELLDAARRDMDAESQTWDGVRVELSVIDFATGDLLWRESWATPPTKDVLAEFWQPATAAAKAAVTPLAVLTTCAPLGRQSSNPTNAAAAVAAEATVTVDWGDGPESNRRVTATTEPADGFEITGPAVLVTTDTTVSVPQGWRLVKQGPWLRMTEAT